jgi:hypothetical protein
MDVRGTHRVQHRLERPKCTPLAPECNMGLAPMIAPMEWDFRQKLTPNAERRSTPNAE